MEGQNQTKLNGLNGLNNSYLFNQSNQIGRPILIKTLSEIHWMTALDQLKNENLNTIEAGSSGVWTFKVRKCGDNEFMRQTFKKEKLIKIDFF